MIRPFKQFGSGGRGWETKDPKSRDPTKKAPGPKNQSRYETKELAEAIAGGKKLLEFVTAEGIFRYQTYPD